MTGIRFLRASKTRCENNQEEHKASHIRLHPLSLLQFGSYGDLSTGDCEFPLPGLVATLRNRNRVQ